MPPSTAPSSSSHYASVFRASLFAHHVVLITGGGTGIGRCVAHELASLGALVVLAGRREDVLKQTCAEIHAAGLRADHVVMNVRDEEQVRDAVAAVTKKHGHITDLVSNAGGQFASPAESISGKGWRSVVDLNLNGTWNVVKAVFLARDETRPLSVVCVVADVLNGKPWMAHTSAARAGVVNLTVTLAQEWGPKGVRLNCVAPGTILGNGMNNYPPPVRERAAGSHNLNPLGRMGTEAEISATIAFLLSPAAHYITGTCVQATGGAHLRKGAEDPEPWADESLVPPYFGFRNVVGSGGEQQQQAGYFAGGAAPEGFEELVAKYDKIKAKI